MSSERHPRWATLIDKSGNLYRITPTLYRSEQLLNSHAAQLHALGIATVISFRAFHSDRKALHDSGIALHRIPMHTWRIRDRDVLAALALIDTAQQQGAVLIHCLHGADRTGLVSAMYRMLHQGWSKEEALDELENGGYGFHAMWKNIPNYIRRLDLDDFRQRLAAAAAAPVSAE
jgi:protein tyrosine/serine phosphatase